MDIEGAADHARSLQSRVSRVVVFFTFYWQVEVTEACILRDEAPDCKSGKIAQRGR